MSKFSFGTKISASAAIHTGRCYFAGILIATDGANDPTITVYKNTAASGDEVLPTTTFNASALGANGVMVPFPQLCPAGAYVEITCAGTCEVTPYLVV